LLAAGGGVVLPADVVLGLLLPFLLLVEVYEGSRSLALPRSPGVGQLISRQEWQLIFPVEGVPEREV
jgi:hypothetical protein